MVGVGVVLAILGIMLKRKPGKAFGAWNIPANESPRRPHPKGIKRWMC
jgi:hypothetical protein